MNIASKALDEYEQHGRLLPDTIKRLIHTITSSNNPFDAISAAADTACFHAAEAVSRRLHDSDPMVRWIAAATLFTRFRNPRWFAECLDMAANETDTVVRSVCLVGVGELLPLVEDCKLRTKGAELLLKILSDESEFPEIRADAYEGILAALGVFPEDRPSVRDFSAYKKPGAERKIQEFESRYLGERHSGV
jgi:hypothetical protein